MNEAPRVAIDAIVPSFAVGGSERVVLALLGSLPSDSFDIRLLVLNPSGPLAEAASRFPNRVHIGAKRLRYGLTKVISTIRDRRPDYLFCSQVHLNIAMLAAFPFLSGTRLVMREANMPSLCLNGGHWPSWYGWAYRRLLPRAHGVIATSNAMAAEFERDFRIPKDRISTIPNPVDRKMLRTQASPVRRYPGPGRRFVAVGRLVYQKGFDRLVPLMRECDPADRLTVVGAGPEHDNLVELVSSSSLTQRVEFLGFDPVPWALMAGADALLMPSRWEGMPNAALEALACGTPVIASATSGG
ncbi:MAG: glycosyltransferase, partial [Rhodospirillaceae bacterium]|nr:glycosyltransferase [Rhodospirillaceae bacterium]